MIMLNIHVKSDHQARTKTNLVKNHSVGSVSTKASIHHVVKYHCVQCDYQARTKRNLIPNIRVVSWRT